MLRQCARIKGKHSARGGASVLYSKAKAGGMLIPCNPQLFYKQRAAAQVVIF